MHVIETHRRVYFEVFGVLALLTALELLVFNLGIARPWLIATLIVCAISKAMCVALFYMHLRYEARTLRLTVTVPMVLPVAFLIAGLLDMQIRG